MTTSPRVREPLWPALVRHARLWRQCLSIAIVRESQFRASFYSTILVGLTQIVLGLVPVLILFEHTESVSGWTRADMIVMLGMFQIMEGFYGVFYSRNIYELPQGVQHGTLDQMLIRPVNAQFYASLRWVRPEQLFNVVGGLVIVVVGLAQGRGMPGPGQMAQALILVVVGTVLLGCASMAIAYLSFWMTSVYALIFFYANDVLGAGRYPVSFFPFFMRVVLTLLVPLAFAVTFPAQAITQGISWWVVLAAIGFAGLAIWLVRQFWNIAIKRYSSASS